ncbi:hypothetical protein [Rhizobium sp. LC145]|uniref:hypothetical protein n=1 Tax=Rhizobium sp. LC145 TaxID=1120688 RepID=UPI00062A1718|nr:hypothetical protein [Rhizobium sp. LC145]KKX24314.1 hypothetical protein YH62_27555 [Rhizobium sp. LC145]TKT46185.1 hypothetical protein FDR95_23800 [Rhizobiaceae bacterium LC148]
MKKATSSPAKVGETTTAAPENGAVEYRIKPGVPWINGKRVKDQQTVTLNAQEAAYDLGLGRISPAAQPVPDDWPAPAIGAGADDGRD